MLIRIAFGFLRRGDIVGDGFDIGSHDRSVGVQKLIAAYDEYIKLLEESEKGMIGLAYVHGYRCPENLVSRGAELREKIARLKTTLND
jgi:hypothetical protein